MKVEQVLRLRVRRQTEKVIQLLEIGDAEHFRSCQKEKVLIQQYRAGGDKV